MAPENVGSVSDASKIQKHNMAQKKKRKLHIEGPNYLMLGPKWPLEFWFKSISGNLTHCILCTHSKYLAKVLSFNCLFIVHITAVQSKNAVCAFIKHSIYFHYTYSLTWSTPMLKSCIYTGLIEQILPLIMKENWSSTCFCRISL